MFSFLFWKKIPPLLTFSFISVYQCNGITKDWSFFRFRLELRQVQLELRQVRAGALSGFCSLNLRMNNFRKVIYCCTTSTRSMKAVILTSMKIWIHCHRSILNMLATITGISPDDYHLGFLWNILFITMGNVLRIASTSSVLIFAVDSNLEITFVNTCWITIMTDRHFTG